MLADQARDGVGYLLLFRQDGDRLVELTPSALVGPCSYRDACPGQPPASGW
jgi:hypothetical protein